MSHVIRLLTDRDVWWRPEEGILTNTFLFYVAICNYLCRGGYIDKYISFLRSYMQLSLQEISFNILFYSYLNKYMSTLGLITLYVYVS